jgi:hypothetical protein
MGDWAQVDILSCSRNENYDSMTDSRVLFFLPEGLFVTLVLHSATVVVNALSFPTKNEPFPNQPCHLMESVQ